ncbi:MAG TPA: hypothetical protein PLX89_22725 [Verrucomicrobiota bacterium]|nr:hypothetical protein [Verrucomicrobiota bacterium]
MPYIPQARWLQPVLLVRYLVGCLVLFAGTLVVSICGQGSTAQSITWTGTTNDILSLDVAYLFGATASSGLPVTLRVDTGPAVLGNGMITATNLGTVVVTAEQTGDETYLPGRATRTFNVRQALLTPVGEHNGRLLGGRGVNLVGNLAYLLVPDGLEVIDVSQPTNPLRVGGVDILGDAFGIDVAGNYAYVADGNGGLKVLDVSNPANPVQVGETDTGSAAQRVQVVGNYAYVADAKSGLLVIDVSNPSRPTRVGGVQSGDGAIDVQVVDNYAYVVDQQTGLVVLDMSNPANWVRVGQYDTMGLASGVKVVEKYAYLTAEEGLLVIDVSNPVSPSLAGRYGFSTWGSIEVAGSNAYVMGSGPFGVGYMYVIDMSNPANPTKIGAYQTGYYGGLKVAGNRVYVASHGLRILELRLGYPQNFEHPLPGEVPLPGVSMPSLATVSSGLPLTVSVVSGPATVVSKQLVLTDLGLVIVRFEQAGDDAFLPLSLDWTVTVTPPQIGVRQAGGEVELHWPAGLTGFKLQFADSLPPESEWQNVSASPVEANGEASLRRDQAAPQAHYRLFKP